MDSSNTEKILELIKQYNLTIDISQKNNILKTLFKLLKDKENFIVDSLVKTRQEIYEFSSLSHIIDSNINENNSDYTTILLEIDTTLRIQQKLLNQLFSINTLYYSQRSIINNENNKTIDDKVVRINGYDTEMVQIIEDGNKQDNNDDLSESIPKTSYNIKE